MKYLIIPKLRDVLDYYLITTILGKWRFHAGRQFYVNLTLLLTIIF